MMARAHISIKSLTKCKLFNPFNKINKHNKKTTLCAGSSSFSFSPVSVKKNWYYFVSEASKFRNLFFLPRKFFWQILMVLHPILRLQSNQTMLISVGKLFWQILMVLHQILRQQSCQTTSDLENIFDKFWWFCIQFWGYRVTKLYYCWKIILTNFDGVASNFEATE